MRKSTNKKFILFTLTFLILVSFSTGFVSADDGTDGPIRPSEIPTHIFEPWTMISDSLWTPEDITEELSLITPRIVGGVAVTPENAYPWIASLQYGGVPYCGATLIHANWAISAAHCWVNPEGELYVVDPSVDKLVFGEYDLGTTSGNEQEIGIVSVTLHPDFNHTSLSNDIALLQLQTSPLISAYVQPLSLIDLDYTLSSKPIGKTVYIAGWGDTSYGGTSSDILLHTSFQAIDDSYCGNYGAFYDSESMLCAGVYAGGYDTCQGDSGGPLVYQGGDTGTSWYLAGVTSWGYECAREGYPGVYANLSSSIIMDWIRSTLNEGTTTIGVYDPHSSYYYMRGENSNSPSIPDVAVGFGAANGGWTPLSGDWDGDGDDTVGIYDPVNSLFYYSNSNSSGVSEFGMWFGVPNGGWIPLAGDWNGDGEDTFGIYDPVNSYFYLSNSRTNPTVDFAVGYGVPNGGWIPLVGDWDGDGDDTIGIYDPFSSLFYLRNENTSGVSDYGMWFGVPNAGWVPLIGDWNGDGVDTIGVYDPANAYFFLKDNNFAGITDYSLWYGPGGSGWIPLAGDWDGE